MSIGQILVIVIICFILFGSSNLGQIMKDIAKSIRIFKNELKKNDDN
ncbi:MAG: twin-arginine translocase TatA/TatE family subunit [Pseudomonadota bacterium]